VKLLFVSDYFCEFFKIVSQFKCLTLYNFQLMALLIMSSFQHVHHNIDDDTEKNKSVDNFLIFQWSYMNRIVNKGNKTRIRTKKRKKKEQRFHFRRIVSKFYIFLQDKFGWLSVWLWQPQVLLWVGRDGCDLKPAVKSKASFQPRLHILWGRHDKLIVKLL